MTAFRRLLLAASALSLVTATGAVAQPATQSAPPANLVQRPAPAGAPNILLVLLDDVGFGAASTFGGPAVTPTLDALAKDGLRYNRFHTTAICSPTRSSLLTGRNPHATGIGAVMNTADGRPGYSGYHGKDTATVAEILRQNGYSTAAYGKWHQTPDWEISQSGPFDRWPTGEGFEAFYGFQGGETSQFEPTLYDGTRPVMRPPGEGYHLTEDLADRSIAWLRAQHSVTPNKPFFLYIAPGGIHAPIQAPADYVERYRGKFDGGWDKLREQIFEREKRLGVIPANAKLTPRPEELPAWDSLTLEQKKFSARLMEAYAGFLAHTDEQIGRVVESLKASGQYDNTIIVYVVGDNGASMEGGVQGSLSYMGGLYGIPESDAAKFARIDEIGGAASYAHVNSAWAWATNAPFPWGKTMPNTLGGVRNPLIISWPEGIKDKGGLRSQFGHVNDIVPTLLDVAGLEAPASVNGVAQKPMNGVSLRYTFDAPKAAEQHRTQYFEVFGRRSIYHDGWFAGANHGVVPWKVSMTDTPPEEDKWELYNLREDFSQSKDLAAEQPAKLAELKQLFEREAAANQVLPISGIRLFNRGLPELSAGVTTATYYPGAVGVPETALPKIANRSWSISASLAATPSTQGVVAAVGGDSAGWSLYLDEQRHAVFRYKLFDLQTLDLRTAAPLPPGEHELKIDFAYEGEGFAQGGDLRLIVDGKEAAAGRLAATSPSLFTIDETFDVGIDRGSPVGAYPADTLPGYAFAGGAIKHVTIDLK
jgi:arylsulfatase A-like enzyme